MMNRRDFLRAASASAMGVTLFGTPRSSSAATPFPGPYWLFVEARGGWDPTSFCDPKGAGLGLEGDINDYAQSEVGQIGNLRYAPPPNSFRTGGAFHVPNLYSPEDFFTSHYQRLVVANGILFDTNAHSIGQTVAWSGSKTLSYPSIGALIASEFAPQNPLPFVSTTNGPSSNTRGIVPSIVVQGGGINAIREVALPNHSNVFNSNPNTFYHADPVRQEIAAAAAARRQRQLSQQGLPRISDAMSYQDGLKALDPALLTDFVDALGATSTPNAYLETRGSDARGFFERGQTAFSAFESGAAASALISFGTFDTHSNHDERHYPKIVDYLAVVDNLIADATARGFGDQLIIVMASDFARTAKLNDDQGKDHWGHGSALVWGGPAHINGNRVVGATDDTQISVPIDPVSLLPDAGGIDLTNEVIHQALRRVAGIHDRASVTESFPFVEAALPIFSV